MEIDGVKKQLEDGDFLVMVSDGVLEYLHVDEPEETMGEIIESFRYEQSRQTCKGNFRAGNALYRRKSNG